MTGDIQRYRDNLRDELNGAALYAALAAAEADPLRKDLFLQLSQAEVQHARLWREKLAAASVGGAGRASGHDIARAEPWHRGVGSGNNLRAAVLGANDGLVSNFCLVM